MKRHILIYGGAFNPPTRAHTMITQELINRARRTGEEVWLLPSGDRRDKSIHVAHSTRLAYLTTMIEGCKRDGVKVEIDTSELTSRNPTQTIDTVRRLEKQYAGTQFTWVFGVDSVETMSGWCGGTWLYEHLDMLLIPREGYTLESLPPQATLLSLVTPKMSSTEVRERLAKHQPFQEFVTEPIYRLLLTT